jgi:hypothetical protein
MLVNNACAILNFQYAVPVTQQLAGTMILDKDLADGKQHEISEAEYYRYRDGTKLPVAYRFTWSNQNWDFGCADGYGFVYAFGRHDGRYFAQKTPLLDPTEVGISIDRQIKAPELLHEPRKQRMESVASLWRPAWRKVALGLPEFARGRFRKNVGTRMTVCEHDQQFTSTVTANDGRAGDFVVHENLCFVKLPDRDCAWAVLKGEGLVERIEFESKRRNPDQAANHLDRLRSRSTQTDGICR